MVAMVSTHSRPKAAANEASAPNHRTPCFNTQPPEGGCKPGPSTTGRPQCFNTQPPEGGCRTPAPPRRPSVCFNTQPPEGGCQCWAGCFCKARSSFNTQPPEGGCLRFRAGEPPPAPFQHTAARRRLPAGQMERCSVCSFNTQPPEGGCVTQSDTLTGDKVSTHSRPKAAARGAGCKIIFEEVSTHSRPKAAANGCTVRTIYGTVSTHSRPKAAAYIRESTISTAKFQHTAARRRLRKGHINQRRNTMFQHTAARRRLPDWYNNGDGLRLVSTHSRPKAAARAQISDNRR